MSCMVHITAVVLTHNDASIITRCLHGIQWCDEVIVVDDNSTDGTMAIAKKFGAKAYIHPLHDDFAAQRNFGLEKAKGPWALFVDSDEVISDELAREIQGLSLDQNGYFMKRKDWWGGRWLTHGETGNTKLLRLAKKDAGKWEQPVHEEWKIAGNVKTLVNPLLHYPHQNVAQFLEEISRYSGVYAKYLAVKGIREPMWHIVAKPVSKFFVNYIWRLGFLDGTAGVVIALMMSFHSFLVRGKLWQLHDRKKNII